MRGGARGAVRRAILLLVLAAAPAAFADRVLVFAAASLKESLDIAAAAFQRASGHRIVISYAGSNVLARQIENGAPADVFFSADTDWIEYLEKRGFAVAGSRRDLLGNDLVLVAPRESHATLGLVPGVNLAGALGDGRLALANPDTVPAGKYAKAALLSLGAWDALQKRLAPTDNVRAALVLVARGEAPLGIVYRTDAMAETRVRIVDTFPEGSHAPIVYPLIRVRHPGASATAAAAVAFTAYLGSAEARGICERFGFRPL